MARNSKTRVMVFGNFDILHKGHLNFFKQAREVAANPYLIVSVARDLNVKKIKGRKPGFNEKQRLCQVKKCSLVQRAVLGGLKNYLPHIVKENPDVIALGYDQKIYVKNLKQLLAKKGLNVRVARLRAFYPKRYKSSLVRRKLA